METSLYKAVSGAFTQTLVGGIKKVTSVPPFSTTCFASRDIGFSRIEPNVPTICLVLQNEKVAWNISGANSMVEAANDVICLGFVDGGSQRRSSLIGSVAGSEQPMTAITIGAHELEDNLLQIDVASSRLGFSNSLLSKRTNYGNFNFSST